MSDEQQHINPWADKLQQAPLPDADASWSGMKSLLDRHMPEKKRKRRFLFILFPVLVLVGLGFGIAFQHIRNSNKMHKTIAGSNLSKSKKPDTITSAEGSLNKASSSIKTTITKNRLSASDSLLHYNNTAKQKATISEGKKSSITNKALNRAGKNSNNIVVKHNYKKPYSNGIRTNVNAKDQPLPTTKKDNQTNESIRSMNSVRNTGIAAKHKKPIRQKERRAYSQTDMINAGAQPDKDVVMNGVAGHSFPEHNTASKESDLALVTTIPSLKDPLDPVHKLATIDSLRGSSLPDSLWRDTNKKEDIILKGWTFGVGINHFFLPSKASKQKELNAEGISNTLTDYIPVPQARYHFNNKLFAQAELQVNAPQVTQQVLLEQKTMQQGSLVFKDEVYVRKLSYLNLPVSIYYSPFKNIYIGAGIQVSRLTNAVAMIQQSVGTVFLPDSLKIMVKAQSIRNDTSYKRLHTSEFRLLGDVSYQVNRFALGMRYNYALQDFVKVPVTATGAITQARNHSLQVYLRYTFLDKRKKIKPRLK